MATETEIRNLRQADLWRQRWNDNMAAECYASDCIVTNMLSGEMARGREELRRQHEAPRRMEITRMLASGDKVAVQMDICRQNRRLKTCAFLIFDEAGLIKTENWYGEGEAGRLVAETHNTTMELGK